MSKAEVTLINRTRFYTAVLAHRANLPDLPDFRPDEPESQQVFPGNHFLDAAPAAIYHDPQYDASVHIATIERTEEIKPGERKEFVFGRITVLVDHESLADTP